MDTKVLEEMGFDLSQEDSIDGVLDYALLEQRVAALSDNGCGYLGADVALANITDPAERAAYKQTHYLERYGNSSKLRNH